MARMVYKTCPDCYGVPAEVRKGPMCYTCKGTGEIVSYEGGIPMPSFPYNPPQGRVCKCPVCEGRGMVASNFYPDLSAYSVSSTGPVTCRSCDGKGVIKV